MERCCEFTRAVNEMDADLASFTETPEQRARRLADLPTRTVGLDLVYHAHRDETPLVNVGDEFNAFKKR